MNDEGKNENEREAAALLYCLRDLRPGRLDVADRDGLVFVLERTARCLVDRRAAALLLSESFLGDLMLLALRLGDSEVAEKTVAVLAGLLGHYPDALPELLRAKDVQMLAAMALTGTVNHAVSTLYNVSILILAFLEGNTKRSEKAKVLNEETLMLLLKAVSESCLNEEGGNDKRKLAHATIKILIGVVQQGSLAFRVMTKNTIPVIMEFTKSIRSVLPIGTTLLDTLKLVGLLGESYYILLKEHRNWIFVILENVYNKILIGCGMKSENMLNNKGKNKKLDPHNLKLLENLLGAFMYMDLKFAETFGSPSITSSKILCIINFITEQHYEKQLYVRITCPSIDAIFHLATLYFIDPYIEKEYFDFTEYHKFLHYSLLHQIIGDWDIIYTMTDNIDSVLKDDEQNLKYELEIYRNCLLDNLSVEYILFCINKLMSFKNYEDTFEYIGLYLEISKYFTFIDNSSNVDYFPQLQEIKKIIEKKTTKQINVKPKILISTLLLGILLIFILIKLVK